MLKLIIIICIEELLSGRFEDLLSKLEHDAAVVRTYFSKETELIDHSNVLIVLIFIKLLAAVDGNIGSSTKR